MQLLPYIRLVAVAPAEAVSEFRGCLILNYIHMGGGGQQPYC
jgi:hypothetical protein